MQIKTIKIKKLKAIVSRLKREGRKIVFTNGCFDILHYGHVRLLEDSKALGDVLIVGMNSDSSVKKIKGSSRPIRRQRERAGILAALAAVDYVAIFDEKTPERIIKDIAPDVLVKGGDWREGAIVGAEFIRSRGGRGVTVPLVGGYSTTSLIEKIRSGRR